MMLRRTWIPGLLLGAALCATSGAQTDAPIPYGPLALPPVTRTITVNPRTIQLIDDAIRTETDLPRKTLLVRDLGLCPMPESAAILKRLLSDTEPLVRAEAVRSLVQIKAADESTLQPLAGDTSAVVQCELVRARFAPSVIQGVTATDPALRAAALSVSINEATDAAILGQLDKLDPPMQAIALRTLADRKYAAAAPAVAKLLDSPSVVTRVAAIHALANLGTVSRDQIALQLKHPHSAVRVAATRVASTLDEPGRIAIAAASLADKDLAVRAEAAKLEVSSDASFVDTYFAQLPLGYEPLRLASRDALIRMASANAQAAPAVAQGAARRLVEADAARRIDGSYVLGKLRSKEGLGDHIKLLRDGDWLVVDQAARSLGPIGDPSAGDELVQTALRSAGEEVLNDMVQFKARAAAGEQAVLSAVLLKHTPVIEATRSFYLNKRASGGVRDAAIYAMGVLGESEDVGKSLRPLLGRTGDIEESTTAITEAIKAMGNGRVKSAKASLEKLLTEPSIDYQYAAHLALGRINGTQTPFNQSPETITPETSIRAIEPTP